MRILLTVIALFAAALALWGLLDMTNAAVGTTDAVPGSLPAMAAGSGGLLKLTAGALILAVCIGFEELIRIGDEIVRRHPGIGDKPGLLKRLVYGPTGKPRRADDE